MADNRLKIDEKIENPKLRELLAERMRIGTSENPDMDKMKLTVEAIVKEMVETAHFIIPMQTSAEIVKEKDGGLAISERADIMFIIFTQPDGSQFIPIFSDNKEYDRWEGRSESFHQIRIDFARVMRLLEDSPEYAGIVLDPFSNNIAVPRAAALQWHEQWQIQTNGHANHALTESALNDVYDLKGYPMQLIATLCETAKTVPAVNRLWLRGMKFNDEDGYLLIVEFSGARQEAFAPLGQAAMNFLNNKPLHIVPFDKGFGGKAADGVAPIYTKS